MDDSHKLHNRDRLSELPDSLIITILSFLQMNDAVRTSVLSKRWKDLWTTVPSLNFGCPRLVGDLDRYRSFVCDALLRWRGAKILRFDLPFFSIIPRSCGFDSCDLDLWLIFAIGKQVEELRLCLVRSRDVDNFYCPPQCLYSCSSIRKLTLSYVKLRIPENVQLSQLTSLTVEGSKLLSELGMTRLLSGALVLEELVLLHMEIGEDYNIRSESLKKLHIGTLTNGSIIFRSMLRISAPNLSTLEICGWVFGGFRLDLDVDIPSLTTAILCFEEYYGYKVNLEDVSHFGMFDRVFGGIRHAQSLTLSVLCIKRLLLLKKKDMLVKFSNAKYLKLYLDDDRVDEMLLAILEMFPNLVTLIVHYTPPKDGDSFSPSEEKIDIPLRHLKTCEIRLSKTSPSILRAVEAVLENGEMLEKMVLQERNEEALGWGTLEKVLSMRRSSSKARVIISKDITH